MILCLWGKIVLEKIRATEKKRWMKQEQMRFNLVLLTPLRLGSESGRALTMGSELLRFKDRKIGGVCFKSYK